MPQFTPHTYLRIGGYALASVLLGLLLLFIASTPLDFLIQASILVSYLAASLALGGILYNHFLRDRPRHGNANGAHGQAAGGFATEQDPSVAAETEPAEEADPSDPPILLLTRHSDTARTIRGILSGWNRSLELVGSCAEAGREILNRLPMHNPRSQLILIVDALHLELDPIHLPALLGQENDLASLKLICIVDRRTRARSQALVEAGYSALLELPIDKTQLFPLILDTEARADVAGSANVVSLSHYRKTLDKQPAKKRILLADNHHADRNRLTKLLRAAGHRVKPVENGEQALDALEQQRFDVALVNLDLPVMNGTQVIKLHRFTTPHHQWASFILMTDQTTPATLRLCRELQVKACLFKPVPTDSLLEMVVAAPQVASSLPALPAAGEHRAKHRPMTRFLHVELLDTKVLHALDQLDNQNAFLPHLISIFEQESVTLLQGLENAAASTHSWRFLELSNILMDNAGQLGAFALYEMCLTLQQLSHQELHATLPDKLEQLRELLARTNRAFSHYLDERETQRSDRH